MVNGRRKRVDKLKGNAARAKHQTSHSGSQMVDVRTAMKRLSRPLAIVSHTRSASNAACISTWNHAAGDAKYEKTGGENEVY